MESRRTSYSPSPVPTGMDLSLLGWLRREFASVARGLLTLQPDLIPLAAPPERPTEGMLRYANGTDWDPGSGKGVYVFDGTTWVKL